MVFESTAAILGSQPKIFGIFFSTSLIILIVGHKTTIFFLCRQHALTKEKVQPARVDLFTQIMPFFLRSSSASWSWILKPVIVHSLLVFYGEDLFTFHFISFTPLRGLHLSGKNLQRIKRRHPTKLLFIYLSLLEVHTKKGC
jgi:hypothetical protein